MQRRKLLSSIFVQKVKQIFTPAPKQENNTITLIPYNSAYRMLSTEIKRLIYIRKKFPEKFAGRILAAQKLWGVS